MKKLAASLILATLFTAAAHADPKHPAWSRSANVYEVNLRQYSKDGTLNALTADLPRLKQLGVEIIWLMPLQPIGETNRKGTLGSYYAVKDYTAVNPEFGGIDDVRKLVKQARALGMHVILDWAGSQTASDHPWTTQHPEWYKKNETAESADVIALDYSNKELWSAMTAAMAFWVKDVGVDGFRADAATMVPTEFWEQARAQLDKIKPVFMLAAADDPSLHAKAFDASEDVTLHDILKKIGKGQAGAAELRAYVSNPPKGYGRDAYRLQFTSNHAINASEGTDQELYGPAWGAMQVLSYTLPGIPLVYNGQEARLDKKLALFEKDAIDWHNYPLEGFIAGLNALKKQNAALANGAAGGAVQLLDVGNEQVFAFKRQAGANHVRVIVNTTGQAQKYKLAGDPGPTVIKPWRWRIIVPN
ncbi:alpha-amylase [Duganella sp. FT94W]|uniref:Alpha-amylase n=1 Tax=Duganella lactea TaxID=2692173 RepID=A0ABW9VE23_9BURK|nr:alpha-amylase family glycosyl hydrolase [Duganella lactea]MYM36997.1 alpha-amylase [Duganella lactea]